jgi:hypothetical protein
MENISILYIGLGPKFSVSLKPAQLTFLSLFPLWLTWWPSMWPKWPSELALIAVMVGPPRAPGQTAQD